MISRLACLPLILIFATTLTAQQDAISVTVEPTHVTLNSGQTQKFSADVQGAQPGTEVIWVVMQKHGGSISQDGIFTAKTVGIYCVVALVITNGSVSRSRCVRVTVLGQYDEPIR